MKYAKTIGWMRREKRDLAFWKAYQVAIYEDQVACNKRDQGSKITFEI